MSKWQVWSWNKGSWTVVDDGPEAYAKRAAARRNESAAEFEIRGAKFLALPPGHAPDEADAPGYSVPAAAPVPRVIGDVTGTNGMRVTVGVQGDAALIRTWGIGAVEFDAAQREEFAQLWVAASLEADRAGAAGREAGPAMIAMIEPGRDEVAVLNYPPGILVRVQQWNPASGYWQVYDYGGHPDYGLIMAVPGDRVHLGWGATSMSYGSLAGVRNGHHSRDRAVWHAAAKAAKDGGVVYVRHELQRILGKSVWVAVSLRTGEGAK